MNTSPLTSSQTVGPFFGPALLREDALRNVMIKPETVGERIRIEGRVLDGDGLPVPDAMVEIWQANSYGRYNHSIDKGPTQLDPSFWDLAVQAQWKRVVTGLKRSNQGVSQFYQDKLQAPHICVTVFSRGLLNHLVTRLYFEDEQTNAEDPILLCVPDKRRSTLLARRESRVGMIVYQFDIIMQGAGETAFFNL